MSNRDRRALTKDPIHHSSRHYSRRQALASTWTWTLRRLIPLTFASRGRSQRSRSSWNAGSPSPSSSTYRSRPTESQQQQQCHGARGAVVTAWIAQAGMWGCCYLRSFSASFVEQACGTIGPELASFLFLIIPTYCANDRKLSMSSY